MDDLVMINDLQVKVREVLNGVGFKDDWTLGMSHFGGSDVGLTLSKNWTISEEDLIKGQPVAAWIEEITTRIKDDILSSPVVRQEIDNRNAIIAELKCKVKNLEDFRKHYELEFEQKHGRVYDLQQKSK